MNVRAKTTAQRSEESVSTNTANIDASVRRDSKGMARHAEVSPRDSFAHCHWTNYNTSRDKILQDGYLVNIPLQADGISQDNVRG